MDLFLTERIHFALMLVLSRKVGERILLGDNIRITVVRVSGGGVRLGIEAPSDIAVVREEVMDAQATASTKTDVTKADLEV